MPQATVNWTPRRIRLLKKAVTIAKRNGHDQFQLRLPEHEPLDFVTRYAEYLIQYLETHAPKEPHV